MSLRRLLPTLNNAGRRLVLAEVLGQPLAIQLARQRAERARAARDDVQLRTEPSESSESTLNESKLTEVELEERELKEPELKEPEQGESTFELHRKDARGETDG